MDNIFYNHKTVQSLLDTIENLEDKILRSNDRKNINEMELLSSGLSQSNVNISSESISQTSPLYTQSHTDITNSDNSENESVKGKAIENISTEVGSLTISNNQNIQGKYIGAATGSKFANLFLKQMNLNRLNEINSNVSDDFDSFDSYVSKSYAPLPPFRIAKYAVLKYINCIHIYYPLLILQNLELSLHNMYNSPRDLTLQDKFILFIVISIGLDRSEKDQELINYNNQFKPIEYFNTAYRYLEEILSNRSENSLQAVLLIIIWLLNTNVLKDDNGDLWHFARFSMSLAMELGVHRYNPDWDFGEIKNELRNRLFWCTYILERKVAMKFGRGLSLRKQAIDTPLPHLLKNDSIYDHSTFGGNGLAIYNKIQFRPCLLLIQLCEIYGDLLETVYISRTRGSIPILPDEQILNSKIQLQNSLNKWMLQIDNQIPNSLDCYYELKIRYCITSIILNRPSPSFPEPDNNSILKCKNECQKCIDSYTWLINNGWKINPVSLHDLVNVGLTMIYCCWKTESNSNLLKEFSVKTLKIMSGVIYYYPNFVKFKNLFLIVSSIIIDGYGNTENPSVSNESNNSIREEFLFQNIPQQLQQVKASIQYPNASPNNNLSSNIEFNDWFTQELFQDVFRQYYFQNNDPIMEDLENLFNHS